MTDYEDLEKTRQRDHYIGLAERDANRADVDDERRRMTVPPGESKHPALHVKPIPEDLEHGWSEPKRNDEAADAAFYEIRAMLKGVKYAEAKAAPKPILLNEQEFLALHQ